MWWSRTSSVRGTSAASQSTVRGCGPNRTETRCSVAEACRRTGALCWQFFQRARLGKHLGKVSGVVQKETWPGCQVSVTFQDDITQAGKRDRMLQMPASPACSRILGGHTQRLDPGALLNHTLKTGMLEREGFTMCGRRMTGRGNTLVWSEGRVCPRQGRPAPLNLES